MFVCMHVSCIVWLCVRCVHALCACMYACVHACVHVCMCCVLYVFESFAHCIGKSEKCHRSIFQRSSRVASVFCVCTPYKSHCLINIFMDDSIDSWQVCGVQPLGVTENAMFIINLDHAHFDDPKANNVGSQQ